MEPEPIEVEEEKETKDGKDTNEEKEAKRENENEDKLLRSVIYIGDIRVKLEEEKETKDGKDTNEEKEAKGESEIEGEQEKTKRERDRIHAELLSKPPHGSEVFIGGMPLSATEEELKEFCKYVGEVVEVTIVRKEVYAIAFVSFRTVDMASKAIKELHKYEFKGKKVRCKMSNTKNTIFIGNIPIQWGESDLKNAVDQVGPGVICVLVMTVKEVFVKNLPKNVTVKQIKELFERHGDIENVVLPRSKEGRQKGYAFVHFKDCANAMKALKNTERHELNGAVLNCSMARSQRDEKPETDAIMRRGPPVLMPSYSSRTGYGSAPPAYLAPERSVVRPLLYAETTNQGIIWQLVVPTTPSRTQLPGVYFSGLLPPLNLFPPVRTQLPVVFSSSILSLLGQDNPSRYGEARNLIRDLYPEVNERELQVLQPELREMLSYWRQSNRNVVLRDTNSRQMLGRSLWDMIQEWREINRCESLRLDVDHMSYEDLLALGERIGVVNTGVNEDFVNENLRQTAALAPLENDSSKCCICQEEYEHLDQLGTLDCGHDFHAKCIKMWLAKSNLCPICKQPGIKTWHFDKK